MKLLIIGSRSVTSFPLEAHMPAGVTCIISGGARGVDTLAERYADANRLSKIILRPDYARYGKSAPLRRNEEALALCDAVLAVWDGRSRGTKYTISLAERVGKPVSVLLTEPAE